MQSNCAISGMSVRRTVHLDLDKISAWISVISEAYTEISMVSLFLSLFVTASVSVSVSLSLSLSFTLSLSTNLFQNEHGMVEKLLQLLVREVDTHLLKGVHLCRKDQY